MDTAKDIVRDTDTSGADSAGPVSSCTVTIGGEDFAVDPRSGSLNYSFTFFTGNVNYGQTPFTLSLQYQQNAAGSYVGGFTDDDKHAHPYGVSAYLPTPEPKAMEDSSNLDDAGGVWDLNLPVITISTSKVSKFYGKDKILATVSLGNVSYQYLLKTPDTNSVNYISDYTAAFLSATKDSDGNPIPPLYSIDGRYLRISHPSGPVTDQILVQDKYGTTYLFRFTVLYGYKGVNKYDPTYNSSNNADADQLFVYRIQNIFYANGQTLNFTYTDSWESPQQHTLTIGDTIGNIIADFKWDDKSGTMQLANQQGALAATHSLTSNPGDCRIRTIEDLISKRCIEFNYLINQAVPYSWQNQTSLCLITNKYTGYSTKIQYQQFNSNHAYDAGCNKFSLAEIAVKTVENFDDQGKSLSKSSYDFGFSETSSSNFILPQDSDKKTYASGLNHWLDNIFYDNNDSDGCSSSSRIDAASKTYATNIQTTYPDTARNRLQTFSYDALGRTLCEEVKATDGPSKGQSLAKTNYSYEETARELRAKSFTDLSYSYASPLITKSQVNIASLNGVVLEDESDDDFLSLTQTYSYNENGNPVTEVSPLGQMTEYTYLPASQTCPENERLIQSVKTHSIGDHGASYKLETQSFNIFEIALTDGGFFLQKVTLPVSNSEIHYDASSDTTYSYRTDTMGGYIGGHKYYDGDQVIFNGFLTQRGQIDDTGVSDVAATEIIYTPTIVIDLGRKLLNVSSCINGSTRDGVVVTSQERGNSTINFMGYPLEQTNVLEQITDQTYDNLGRLTAVTTLVDTTIAQRTTYAYDLNDDLSLDKDTARFSRRVTDPFGNSTVQLFDARQRHISTYLTLNGGSQVKTAAYAYDNANKLTNQFNYGDNYVKSIAYYYSPGTPILVATVPNYGLAKGRVLDGLNGVSITFNYAPAGYPAPPTTIGEIFGQVTISRADNTSQLVQMIGLIDANVATNLLKGLDLVALTVDGGLPPKLVPLGGNPNPWTPSGMTPDHLCTLYQTIAVLPQDDPSGEDCHLMEVKIYGYDSWHRHIRTTHQTYIKSGLGNPTSLMFSETESVRQFDTAHRTVSFIYPQGQEKSCTYNLFNGLQDSSLTVMGVTTHLGTFMHDGIGRVVAYKDSLNGSVIRATYLLSGLLNSRTDAYGNTTTYFYDPGTMKLSQSILTPAAGGDPIVVNRAYNSHLQPVSVSDNQGNLYQWSFADSGLLLSQSLTLAAVNQEQPYQFTYCYDSYGDLTSVADPFLPYPLQVESSCVMVQNNLSSHGFDIQRDSYGRISQLMAGSFHGVNRNFGYHPVSGLLMTDEMKNLPAVFACGDTGALSLSTTLGYDQNLRTVSKEVCRSDLSTTAKFTQTYDNSNRVATRGRVDFQGLVLNETFSYDGQTGFLVGYGNDVGTAAPSTYIGSITTIGFADYTYDLYGNLIQANFESGSGSPTAILRNYNYAPPGSTTANPFQLISIEEQDILGFENSVTRSGTFSYDVAGNTVSDGYGRTFTYDAHGLIHSIQRADQQLEVFTRDGLGRVITRTAPWLAGPVHDFGVARFQEGSQLWQTEFFCGTACYTCAPGGVTPATEQSAFVSIDDLARQSVQTISYGANPAFQPTGATSYLPYGSATDLSHPGNGYPANLENQADYPASVMGSAIGADTGTGLRLMASYRVYDPVLGRFLQWDSMSPFGKGGLNGYAYAGNDPVNFWDPTGHYQSVKARRYGPKPIEAHHHSEGSFWVGFLAGFKHGVKAFFMTPYNYAKNFTEDLAHGRWVGGLEMGFDLAVDSYVQAYSGVLGTMALQETVALSPSKIFSGKSPVKSTCGGNRDPYQWGYSLGSTAGELADTAVLALTFAAVGSGVGAVADGFGDAAADSSGAIDTSVTSDANNNSRLQINERTPDNDNAVRMGETDSASGASSARIEVGEGSDRAEGRSEANENLSAWRRVGKRIWNNWVFRNVILPHDPQDPLPWEEGLSSGQRAKAFVTVTGEAFSQGRSFTDHLASWGGSTTPDGKHSSSNDPTAHAKVNSQSPAKSGLPLDPSHTTPSTKPMPYSPPQPPPLDLPGY